MKIRGARETGAAIWQALTGRAFSTESKKTVQEKTRDMVDRWGSTKAVAEKLGVTVRTVQRRLKGAGVKEENREAFDRAHRESRITPGRKGKFGGGGTSTGRDETGDVVTGPSGSGMRIYGLIEVSEDRRRRWISPGPHLTPDQLNNVVQALIDGGPEAARAELNVSIGNYVPGMKVLEIDEILYDGE